MITNFERETHELNHYELKTLLPVLSIGLNRKIGKLNAITNKDICLSMKQAGYKLTDARLRKIIHHIRVNNLIPLLIATSKGYYISNDENEINQYIKSLSERINSIQEIKDALMHQLITK